MNAPIINIQQPSTTYGVNGASYTTVPINMVYPINDGKIGCPQPIYRDQVVTTKPVYPKPNNNCQTCANQENIYNIYPQADYVEQYIPTPYNNNQGYPATAITLPGINYDLYAGTGIYFDQLENGLRINNGGVVSADVRGTPGSGISVINTNTATNPIFQVGVNTPDLVTTSGLVTTIIFNGQAFTPTQGTVIINNGAYGAGLQNLSSPNNTILITPASISQANIDVKPIKINNNTLNPDVSGYPINLIDGTNVNLINTTSNTVSVNVANNAFVKTVNGLSPDPNGNINVNPSRIFYEADKVLTSGDIASLTGAGLDLNGVTPSHGANPPAFATTDGFMLFQNGVFLTLGKFNRSGSNITTSGVSFSVNDVLTWVVIKSS
jgi:hypothetical protein